MTQTFRAVIFLFGLSATVCAQGPPSAAGQTGANQTQEPPGGKHAFGVISNYATADASEEGTVLTAKQKFTIAAKDSFGYPVVVLSAALAGIGQLTDREPSFGQGVKGFAHRLATNYADQSIDTMFTQGVYPVLLHEDSRYFRRGAGSVLSRTGYALSRMMVTHKDAGGWGFNYSEWLGDASAVAISNAYYADDRTPGANSKKLLMQVGTDGLSAVLKEFWPDIRRKVLHKK